MVQHVITAAGEATTALSPALGTSDPTATTLAKALTEAHGRVGDNGTVTVEVSGACTVTIYTYGPGSNTWKPPGASSSAYQKVFSAAGKDYFVASPGALFFLKSDTGSLYCWTDRAPVRGVQHG